MEILAVVLRVLVAAMAAVRHDDSQFGKWHQLAPKDPKGRWYMFLLLRNEADWLASRVVRGWKRSGLCADCVGHILMCVCLNSKVRWVVSAVV
jgi:hypothetical protein